MMAVEGLVKLISQLQSVAALALIFAHYFAVPCLCDWQIPDEEIAPHLLRYDCRADNVLICFQKPDFVLGIGVTFGKVLPYCRFALKAVPELSVAAELQTFLNCVLSAWE